MAVKWVDTDKPQTTSAVTDDIVSKVKRWKQDSEGWTSTWESNQDKYHRMRMRIKKTKNFPFKGCANIRMPTIEIKIRKLKSALINTIFGIRPVVQVIPSPSGNWTTAKKIEKWLDHLIVDKMRLKNKAIIAVDQMLEKGFYLLKPYWRTEITTRVENIDISDLSIEEVMWVFNPTRSPEEITQELLGRLGVDLSEMVAGDNIQEIQKGVMKFLGGDSSVRLELKDVLYDCPDVSLCSPERVYVPTTSGYDPQDCQYIIHEFFLPLGTLKQNAKYKGWKTSDIDDIGATKSLDLKTIDKTRDDREGIERLQENSELVKIWECYCWYDINNDGEQEKCIITLAPEFNKVLRKITLPFHSGKFPFVKLFYELTNDRWFSHRGIPELIEDIVKEIDIQHCQKIDRQTITNAPMFAYRAGMVNLKTTQFVFGQGIPVSGLNGLTDTIAPLNSHNPNVDFSYEREQMILETKVEELIGQVDFTLQSMINKREPRTLGEVQLQQQNMQQVFSLDAEMVKNSFAELFNWIYDLWSQYGDERYTFAYFGKNGYEPITMSREELQNKPTITIRGNDQNTNPQIRIQKAQMIMMSMQNQVALQTGVITPVHIAQGYKRLYQELDIPDWEELVSTPEQVAQMMRQQKQQPPPDDIKFKAGDLTDAEKAQALQKRGIHPDVRGRFLNEKNRRREFSAQELTKVADSITKLTSKERGEYAGGNGNRKKNR